MCVPLPAFYFDYNGVLNVAAFASGGRSPAVRVLVCIMCALFLFAVVAAPPAQAVAVETVAVFGLAAVLSAATAALGYKLSNSAQGKATLSQMCTAFASDATMGAKVLIGMKMYGLQEGMKYIKMQVKNGKTYLDSKVVAWCQQYLGKHGVYDAGGGLSYPDYTDGQKFTFASSSLNSIVSVLQAKYPDVKAKYFTDILKHYDLDISDGRVYYLAYMINYDGYLILRTNLPASNYSPSAVDSNGFITALNGVPCHYYSLNFKSNGDPYYGWNTTHSNAFGRIGVKPSTQNSDYYGYSNYFDVAVSAGNTTGLSGTDTLGKDYINVTLEQILAGLKDWAKDWYDAGVESVLDGAVEGDIDLPLTVGAGAATLNPDVAADEELVYTPSFDLPLEDVRSGDTAASDVTAGQENAKTQTATADISENASVVSSLVNWALDYISPDKGIFSKFPLCVPYDAYLLACSALGVEARGLSDVTGASPGDLDAVIYSADGVEAQSDFQPIISIKNDFTVDGKTYPIDLDIDLSPWEPLVGFFRNGLSLLVLAELIGSEYKRIRGH